MYFLDPYYVPPQCLQEQEYSLVRTEQFKQLAQAVCSQVSRLTVRKVSSDLKGVGITQAENDVTQVVAAYFLARCGPGRGAYLQQQFEFSLEDVTQLKQSPLVKLEQKMRYSELCRQVESKRSLKAVLKAQKSLVVQVLALE